ncbi:MAG TPA: hypothetical protein PKL83_00325 [bacterium]|nr:hypothetical protein [bacterium]
MSDNLDTIREIMKLQIERVITSTGAVHIAGLLELHTHASTHGVALSDLLPVDGNFDQDLLHHFDVVLGCLSNNRLFDQSDLDSVDAVILSLEQTAEDIRERDGHTIYNDEGGLRYIRCINDAELPDDALMSIVELLRTIKLRRLESVLSHEHFIPDDTILNELALRFAECMSEGRTDERPYPSMARTHRKPFTQQDLEAMRVMQADLVIGIDGGGSTWKIATAHSSEGSLLTFDAQERCSTPNLTSGEDPQDLEAFLSEHIIPIVMSLSLETLQMQRLNPRSIEMIGLGGSIGYPVVADLVANNLDVRVERVTKGGALTIDSQKQIGEMIVALLQKAWESEYRIKPTVVYQFANDTPASALGFQLMADSGSFDFNITGIYASGENVAPINPKTGELVNAEAGGLPIDGVNSKWDATRGEEHPFEMMNSGMGMSRVMWNMLHDAQLVPQSLIEKLCLSDSDEVSKLSAEHICKMGGFGRMTDQEISILFGVELEDFEIAQLRYLAGVVVGRALMLVAEMFVGALIYQGACIQDCNARINLEGSIQKSPGIIESLLEYIKKRLESMHDNQQIASVPSVLMRGYPGLIDGENSGSASLDGAVAMGLDAYVQHVMS